ncbi:ThuA domain-containing protein [Marinicella sp. W31]|uniref:ThuA domain-containing protein n=1 Tax=Marinicella sp. W31 TaxID=3023713 RepID=UPI003756C920
MKRVFLCLCLVFCVHAVVAQTLPPHQPLRILIVSDEVNPHGLDDNSLTQPGDIGTALSNASALNIGGGANAILEIGTNQIESATIELQRTLADSLRYDVLIYFAHRIPNNGNNAAGRQGDFVQAVESFLQSGGAVISFHHGIYQTAGKESIQSLLGAQATGSVPWDTMDGQTLIYVGGEHFIGTHEIAYTHQVAYEHPAHGIASDMYPAFVNVPDERYPQMDFNNGNTDCDLSILYETDYVNNGNQHLLSYLKWCQGWGSQIFVYQPGEYQPNALEAGNNFQILLNAIYHLTGGRWDVIFKNGFD